MPKGASFQEVELKIEEFCSLNQLQTNAMKEIPYLCIQLHKMA